ncbi:hypothetical protein [Streptomyces camponoticapitis]|uniref:hypothetical protein n=1 Tax=Streptomyces camponoticapitis TaxID=1616125 RepID=UPI00227CFD5B|nr:hypothetical protein [Streptomyces camponoticapitis]
MSRSSLVEAEAEGVTGGVEEHPDVLLWLVLGHPGAQSDGLGDRRVQIAESRSPTWKSKCIIGRCSPSTGGQTGAR